MLALRRGAVWVCILAAILAKCAAFPSNANANPNANNDAPGRNVDELRPSFVLRQSQAPLFSAAEERIEAEYIVKLKDGITEQQLVEVEETLKNLAGNRGLNIAFTRNLTKLMTGFAARLPGEAIDIVRWMDEVEFVEENEVVYTALPWGLDRIDQDDLPLDSIYSSSPLGDGSGVNVFVLDTGIWYTHSEFEGRALPFFDAFSDGRNGNDCHGHGTHCAGTIGGRTVGVAPGVTLYSGRVLSCTGSGSTSGVIAAMDAVAGSDKKPGVVSMSLGGGYSSSMNLAVQRLTDAGYSVVVAAGNNAGDACHKSPASAPQAITVGATTSNDNLAYYSNYGSCVNILAPGSSVYSAYSGGNNNYRTLSGTSMATPHVAGVAALILEEDPSMDKNQLQDVLVNAAMSGKIDLSGVPSSHRPTTPNKLLHIPSDMANPTTPPSVTTKATTQAPTTAAATAPPRDGTRCKKEDGFDRPGSDINDGSQNIKNDADECCEDCRSTSQCVAWSFNKATGECWLKNTVPSASSVSHFVSGVVKKPGTAPKLFKEAMTFDDAQAKCEEIGMVLGKFSSVERHARLVEILQRNGMGETSIWLNGRQDSTGAWVTTEGAPLGSYQPWQTGEPNGSGRCLQLWASVGHKWDDVPCDSSRPFICQPGYAMRLFKDAKNFDDARSTCEASGMTLVKDTSEQKHASIMALLQVNDFGERDIWLNGHQDSNDAWATTEGMPLGSYQPWQSGEPNGSGRCLQMWADKEHNWDDLPCDTLRSFICQPGLCQNSCPYHGDGECDDGGPGSVSSVCGYATDCDDCGSRPLL